MHSSKTRADQDDTSHSRRETVPWDDIRSDSCDSSDFDWAEVHSSSSRGYLNQTCDTRTDKVHCDWASAHSHWRCDCQAISLHHNKTRASLINTCNCKGKEVLRSFSGSYLDRPRDWCDHKLPRCRCRKDLHPVGHHLRITVPPSGTWDFSGRTLAKEKAALYSNRGWKDQDFVGAFDENPMCSDKARKHHNQH